MTTMMWHNDGHVIFLKLDKNSVVISKVQCPYETNLEAACQVSGICIVRSFLDRYGLECNVGTIAVKSELPIAWSLVGNPATGLEACQVWIIPIEDEFFASWLASQDV